MTSGPGFQFHMRGDFTPDQVRCTLVPSTFAPPPDIVDAIERTWTEFKARPGVHLFDGPLARLEHWRVVGDRLEMAFSRTSYKPFLGTNGRHAARAAALGQHALANGTGTSAALATADGQLVFGLRGPGVALYPGCAHPFGGCLEPHDPLDVFADIRRELREECGVQAEDLSDLRVVAIGEDRGLRQPELTFVARTILPVATVIARLDPSEHHGTWTVAATPAAVAEALHDGRPMTALTRLTLLAYGGLAFGEAWFEAHQVA
jgi:8-oxo-dGTP pyrophosphatase MutT (NUDIX family)